jgi:hypothetical protein
VLVDDDVAEIDADAKLDAPRIRNIGIAQHHFALQLNRTTHRINDARKLDEQTVASGLDDAAAVLVDLGIA